jgi:intracellular sulfur oxidation DsrE/DsrF family protein
MKSLFLTAALVAGLSLTGRAQTPAAMHDAEAFQKGTFAGATADQAHYNAIYQLDSDDPKLIQQTLRNISNALEDNRLKGKITVELIAFSGGTALYRKDQPYEAQLTALKAKGVILAQCLNTLRERKISKDELLPLIAYVPSGNGELIIRQAQGWSLVHP